MFRVGLLLAGCGHLDGTDPVQAIALRIVVAKSGHLVRPIAPDVEQTDTLDPDGKPLAPRAVQIEAARLAGGVCESPRRVDPKGLDVLLIPGGLGVIKTLCSAGIRAEVEVEPQTAALIEACAATGVVLGCIDEGSVLVGWTLRSHAPIELAAGTEPASAASLEAAGQRVSPQSGVPVVNTTPRVVSIQGGGSGHPERAWQVCSSLWDAVQDEVRNG